MSRFKQVTTAAAAIIRRHPNRHRSWVGPQSFDPESLPEAIRMGRKDEYLAKLREGLVQPAQMGLEVRS